MDLEVSVGFVREPWSTLGAQHEQRRHDRSRGTSLTSAANTAPLRSFAASKVRTLLVAATPATVKIHATSASRVVARNRTGGGTLGRSQLVRHASTTMS